MPFLKPLFIYFLNLQKVPDYSDPQRFPKKSIADQHKKKKGKIKYCLSLATTETKPWQCALKVTRLLFSSEVKIQK